MALSPGDKLGPYEIIEPIGKGGMGEVWKAHDPRLKRDVAIKVSTAQFSERFEREAQAIAALNHPNICQLYDVGPNYLVMEFIDGTPLKGPLPLDQTLKYAAQICDALDAAHRKGITHRDLKPANILVTRQGIKLLDFGLAKLNSAMANPVSEATMTMALTGKNEIVGTLYYMSPEQLQAQGTGQEIDARSDIFSFGLVLYEMLTGNRAFQGSSPASVIAAIMERPAPSIADIAPPVLDRVLKTCLAKDPDERWQTARDLKRELEWIASAPESGSASVISAPSLSRLGKVAVAAAAVLAAALAGVAFVAYRATRPGELKPLMRLDADLAVDVSPGAGEGSVLAIAPNGSRLAFVTRSSDGKDHLALQLLDSGLSTVIPDTEGAAIPFFSPDSRWVAFFAGGKLKKISVEGGKPTTLCGASNPRGASWGEDGNIVFAAENRVPLSRVSSSGGDPKPATELDVKNGEISNRYPQVLPGGEAILFQSRTALGSNGEATIYVQSIKTGQRKTLVEGGSYAHYLPSGHLVYMHLGELYAAPMDLKRLELTGPALPIVEDMRIGGNGYAHFDFTPFGILTYVPATNGERSLSWMDNSGKLTPVQGVPPSNYMTHQASPDGTKLALVANDAAGTSLSVYDVAQARMSKIGSFKGPIFGLGWASDSRHLVLGMTADQLAGPGLYWVRADGAGEPQKLLGGANWVFGSTSPDGKLLGYWSAAPPYGLWTLTLDLADPDHPVPGKPESLLKSKVEVRGPSFSRDGRWIGYDSYESVRLEVFVQPFPGLGGKWQVSSRGAGSLRWLMNGRELTYRAPDGLIWVVDFSGKGDSFAANPPRKWSETGVPPVGPQSLDVMPDGKRIAVLVPSADAEVKPQTHVVFLLNFFDELRRKVPVGK
jgi:eukaryotic-like serine/threonine-protein kinase